VKITALLSALASRSIFRLGLFVVGPNLGQNFSKSLGSNCIQGANLNQVLNRKFSQIERTQNRRLATILATNGGLRRDVTTYRSAGKDQPFDFVGLIHS
jgi:hypothetical protein